MGDHEEQIRSLIARHAHTLDDGRFEELSSLYVENGRLTTTIKSWEGAQVIAKVMAKSRSPERRGKHVCFNTLIEYGGESDATAWTDYVFIGPAPNRAVEGYGRYTDSLTLTEAGWRIQERRIDSS